MTSLTTEALHAPGNAASPALAHHLIDGSWTGEPSVERRNPARLDQIAALSPAGTAADARVVPTRSVLS